MAEMLTTKMPHLLAGVAHQNTTNCNICVASGAYGEGGVATKYHEDEQLATSILTCMAFT